VRRTAIALTFQIGAGGGRRIVAIMVPVFLLFLACCDVRAVLLLRGGERRVVLEAVGLWACNVQISAKDLVLKKGLRFAVGF